VRIATKRNSFYVTLGLSRLLYNYSTPETMELYNLVIQDPERVHDDYYYRSRKSLLLKELKERFGALLEVAKGARGEQRWRVGEDNLRHAALVRECLLWFTPWATPCVVPERFDPLSDTIDELNFQGRHPDEEHEVEVNRIHAALHPDCFARLAAANRLATPDERLELPHFFLADDADDNHDHDDRTPNLSEDELRTINDLLAQEATRRKSVSAGFLRVLVDGVERAEIDAEHSAGAQFVVAEEAEVIEVYSSDKKGALLLAAHLLNLDGSKTQKFFITVEGGQRIAFTVNALRDDEGATIGAQVTVAVAETAPMRAASLAARRLSGSVIGAARDLVPASGWWKPVAAFTVLTLLIGGAWWVWSNRRNQNEFVRVTPTPVPTQPAIVPSPDKPKDKEQQPKPPTKKINNGNEVAPPLMARRAPERDETFVERSLLPNSSANTEPGESSTRGAWNRNSMGKPLGEVRRVHVQVVSGIASGERLLTELRARLAVGSSVQLSDADQADAALKISVEPASSRAEDSRVVVIVRAVNANGYVVWPVSSRGSSWRYVGQPRYVAARIVADLSREIKRPNQ